jgi:phage gpG-like protein
MPENELTIKLTQLAQKIRQLTNNDLPRIAGKMAVDFFKQSFINEGFTDTSLERWPEVKRRQDPRVRGARATRKILTGDTGDLGESITYHIRPPSEVVIKAEAYSKTGFNYAPVHNEGVTDAGRNHNVVIPKRQFIGYSATLDKQIEQEIENKLSDLWK